MASTAIEAEKAKPRETTFRLSFGGGLLLEVRPATQKSPGGSKAWIARVQLDGKRRDVGLGTYPSVPLKEARRKAEGLVKTAREGTDPLAAKRATEATARAARKAEEEAGALTFRAVAERLVMAQKDAWTSTKTVASWRLTLDKWAYPKLGDVPVAEVTREHVVAALSPIWVSQPATARKLQRRISATLDFAAAHGWRAADNPASGRVLRLTKALPPVNANGRRWASLPWPKVPGFVATLDAQPGMAARALAFALLTALRSNEVRQTTWGELDFDANLLTISGRRMKGGLVKERPPHRVPLTREILSVLAGAMQEATGEPVTPATLPSQAALRREAMIFPNAHGEALSDAALGATIKRMNGAAGASAPLAWHDVDGRPITAHGFRRSFRSWVDDERPEDAAAAEAQLAHDEPNKVAAAYRGSDLLARRRDLMAAWGSFAAGGAKRGKNVVKLPMNARGKGRAA